MARDCTKFSIRLTYSIIDVRALGRAAWKAARAGGFTSLRDWRDYRRERGLAAVFAEISADGIAPFDAGLELVNYE